MELEKIDHDLFILKNMTNIDNTKINTKLRFLILKNLEYKNLVNNKIKNLRIEKEINIENLKSDIENLKKENKTIEKEIKTKNDNFFNFKKEIHLKKEIIYQNIKKKYKELRENELLLKKNIDNLQKKKKLKKDRVEYLENQLKD